MHAAVGGEGDADALLAPASARHRPAGVPPPVPQARSRPWCAGEGNRPSSQPGRNTVSNSSPLAACSVIRLMRSPVSFCSISITSETCSRNAAQRFELLHRAHEFLQIVQPARRLRRFVGLQHVGVAAFVQHHFGQFGMRQMLAPSRSSARNWRRVRRAPCAPWAAIRRSRRSRAPPPAAASCRGAGKCVQRLHAGIADAALGLVDDALEREIVVALRDQPQIGHGVADFRALIEARAADHAIGQAQRNESGLRIRASGTRRAPAPPSAPKGWPWRCRSSASEATLRASSSASHTPCTWIFSPAIAFGPQRLAEAALVGGDQARSRAQDRGRRAVIALQPDDFGAGKIALEAQDVFHLRAAPAIDRLIVVAHDADIAARCPPAASATDTARHWCPDIRPPACSGSARGNRRGCRDGCAGCCSVSSSRSPKSAAFSAFSRS